MKNENKKKVDIERENIEKAFKDRFPDLLDNSIKNGHSQKEFSKDTGISAGSISKYKSGELPKVYVLETIAKYFNVSMDYIIGKSDTPNYDFDDINKKTGLSQKAIEQLWKFQHNYFPYNEDMDIKEEKDISEFYKPQLNILNLILEDSGGLFLLLDSIVKYKKEFEEYKTFVKDEKQRKTNKLFEVLVQEKKEKMDLQEYRITKMFLYFINQILEKGE